MRRDDDKDFYELFFAIVLFVCLMAGAFWIQHKYSNAKPYFETDIK